MESIRQNMQAKYPAADLSRYFAFLAQAAGTDHKHHVAPRAEFPELARAAKNIVPLSYQEHFYAHYLLALAVPECTAFQQAFCFMANYFTDKIRTDELSRFAEVYERGMIAVAEHGRQLFKKLSVDPVFAAKRDARMSELGKRNHTNPVFSKKLAERMSKMVKALHNDPIYAARRDDRARDRCKAMNADPALAVRRFFRLREKHADPVFAAEHAARARIQFEKLNTPEYRKEVGDRGSKFLTAMRSNVAFEELRHTAHAASLHNRWHIKRNIISPKCTFCMSGRKGVV
jgi:hypothetical protein